MSKDKLTDYSATNSLNTDIGGVNIDEGMLPSDVNNALREVMTHLKDFAEGTQAVNNIKFAGATTTGDINFGDNDKAVFGAGSDLQIYSNAGESYILEGGTGNLNIRANSLYLENAAGDNYLAGVNGGGTYVYYNGSPKLETTLTGIDVTGTVTADGLTVQSDVADLAVESTNAAGEAWTLRSTYTNTGGAYGSLQVRDEANNIWLRFNQNNGSDEIDLRTNNTDRLNIANNGDVSLYASDGTTQGFYWDASTQRLGINTTSPGARLQVGGNAKLGSATQTTFSGSLTTGGLDVMVGSGTSSGGAFQVWDDNELTTPRFTVTREGKVGIGTASPSSYHTGTRMTVYNSGDSGITIASGTGNAGRLHFADGTTGNEQYRGYIVYAHSNDSMQFATSGTEKMRIDSGGNVGIGTASPAVPLHIYHATTNGVARFESGDATALVQFKDSGTTLVPPSIGAVSNDLVVQINNSEAARFDSSGNVGIGTSTINRGQLQIASGSNAELHLTGSGQTGSGEGMTITSNSTEGNIWYRNNGYFRIATNNSERLRIDSSGNVGIGTSSPSNKLSVEAGSNPAISVTETGAGAVILQGTGSGGRVYSNSGNKLLLGANGQNSHLIVDTGGNVGIGTASPSDKLHVEGDIRVNNAIESANNLNLEAENGALRFYTGSGSPSERARLDASGNLLVGKTTITGAFNTVGIELRATGLVQSTVDSAKPLDLNRKTTTGEIIGFNYNGTAEGSVTITASGVTYNTTSDLRLKENIEPLVATDKLMAMNPVSYNWKSDPDGPRSMGFIAQEMQEIMPEAVAVGDDEDAMMSMDYGRITPILVSALQDAHRKIEELAAEIAELKAK